MKLTKKMIKAIESKTNCGVSVDDDLITIYVGNSYDEDYQIEVNKGNDEVKQILNHCDNYDCGEHFNLWYGRGKGEPSSPIELFENCKEIGENLEELANVLREEIA